MNGKLARLTTRVLPVILIFAVLPLDLSQATSAGATMSTLCSGYASCNQGAFANHGYQSHAWASYWNMTAGNECANYAAYVESTTFGVATPPYRLGDAGQWAASAAAHGVTVNETPSVGSVADWTGGEPGLPFPGHVAIVERVSSGGGSIVISQQHILDTDGYDWIRIHRNPAMNQWESWPTRFIHFSGGPGPLVDGVHYGVRPQRVRALQATGGSLVTVGSDGVRRWQIGMSEGTSPSVTELQGGGLEVAVQSNARDLMTVGGGRSRLRRIRMMANSSPSISAVLGGFEVALQSSAGDVMTAGAAGSRNWHLKMRRDTSPSITAVLGGGYEVAFQSNVGNLMTIGSLGSRNWHLKMRPGTSPSIAALFGGGYEVAIQSADGSLVTIGSAGSRNWHLGMGPGTSPSIAPAFGGKYEAALQSNRGELLTVGVLGSRDWHLRMAPSTSPSITPVFGGGYDVAFQSVTGNLVSVGRTGIHRWRLRMKTRTSPGVPG
jgi:surface antigen